MENRLRVAVYGSSLNMAAIAASLKMNTDLEVVCLNPQSPAALHSLKEFNPAAVAFDLSDPSTGLDAALLRGGTGLLLVGVDPSSNDVLVLSSQPAQALSSVELIHLIRQMAKNTHP